MGRPGPGQNNRVVDLLGHKAQHGDGLGTPGRLLTLCL